MIRLVQNRWKISQRSERCLSAAALVVAMLLLFAGAWLTDAMLAHRAVFTGWTLLALVLLLAMLGVRKKLVMWPLLSTATWVRVHFFSGLFCVFAFLCHVPAGIADGAFEGSLSLLFWIVAGSGLYGAYITRVAPRRLRAIPGEYRYDRIPWHRNALASAARELIEELESSPDQPILRTFYDERLARYFAAGAKPAFLVRPSGSRRRQLLAELTELHRYFSPELRQQCGRLAALIRARDDLDFHHALQLRLRLWLAVHGGLTSSLVIAIAAHVLLVMRFKGT